VIAEAVALCARGPPGALALAARRATKPRCGCAAFSPRAAFGSIIGAVMQSATPVLPVLLLLGTVFGALGAAGAYAISYAEYRQRFLRPGQSAKRMALEVAAMTFAFFVVASLVLGLLLGHAAI
jgi:hypothetical protein